MRLSITGYEPIVIPAEAIVPMAGAFSGETPYVAKVVSRWKQKAYRERKLPLKLACLESIHARLGKLGSYTSYSEPMAGIGLSARILAKHKKLYLNDLDPSCQKVLEHNFPQATVTGNDALEAPLQKADLIFIDFNDFTMKRAFGKYNPILQRAFDAAKNYLMINDCSLFYLRYGKAAFEIYSELLGKPIHSLDDYFHAVSAWYRNFGWELVQASYFSETSFLLLSRKPAKLVIEKILPEDLPLGLVTVQS